jgi:ribosomal protein S1
MKVLLIEHKKKNVSVSQKDLYSEGLLDILSRKLDATISENDVVSFDGKKAVVDFSDKTEFVLTDEELLYDSAEKILQKKLKKRGKLDLQIVKGTKKK